VTRPPKYKHIVHAGIAQDLIDLGEEALKLKALKTIMKVLAGEIIGKPLEDFRSTGDLSDCRKVLFDIRTDMPPRFRLVYREHLEYVDESSKFEIVAIETLAIGERYELEAYIKAATRLGRVGD